MVYAVYRCLYGEDFIKESIESIIENVDKVFVLYSTKIWGNVTEVKYKDEIIKFPKKFDNLIEKVQEIKSDKIVVLDQGEFWTDKPWGNYTSIINGIVIPKYGKPDIFVLPEVDHVFADGDFEIALDLFKDLDLIVAKTKQKELWKSPKYILPFRDRIGTVFWKMEDLEEFPATHGNGQPINNTVLSSLVIPVYVYNLGFMVSKKAMYWKHLTAIAFADIIGDSRPNISWYENKWLNWDYETNNSDLEISIGYEKDLPYAKKYINCRLPDSIMNRYENK